MNIDSVHGYDGCPDWDGTHDALPAWDDLGYTSREQYEEAVENGAEPFRNWSRAHTGRSHEPH
jgi:hypothetical protein